MTTGLQYVGEGVSIYGNYQSAQGQQQAGRATAALLRIQADQVVVRGRAEAARSRADFFAALDTNRVAAAAGNVDLSTGVSKVINDQFLEISQVESDQIKKNAQLEADSLAAQAENTQDSAEASYHSSLLGLAGSTLSSGSNFNGYS